MKIVVVTGSPRKGGNIFAMVDSFIKAAETKGHEVVRFDAAMMKVGGCRACMTCYKTGKACSFDDDFNAIAPHLLDADAVVYAAPVYWFSCPAQIKGVIDRMFSFVIGNKDVSGKKCGIITCCEEHDPTVMEVATMPLHRTFDFLKWNLVGEVCVPGVFEKGDIDKTDGCTQAAEFAAKF